MANLRIAELDFDTIKTNLKTYLQSQSEFSDYDFEGAGLSVLIDLLAYNTHYNAYLANMLANEMFLDSAVKRSSVVSIAKHLGYTPRSVTGAKATIDITVTNPTNNPATLTLERYSSFSTSTGGTSFTFLTTEPYTIQPVNGVYKFGNIPVKEGRLLDYAYTVVSPGPDEKFEIPNAAVDTSTMLVTVQNSATDTTLTTYTQATEITDLNGNSTVYFLEENPLGNYQIYFGDNILGKKLTTGNIVRIQYLVSVGSAANVSGSISQSFISDNTIGGSSNITITTVINSTGGSEKENISSIKFNAPRSNLTKNRAVTKIDYSTIIKSLYSQVESIAVWGGEENIPPAYGKVFISLKPYTGYVIEDGVKDEIKNVILKDRQVLTVTPEFIDPDYIYVNLTINLNYNKNLTVLSSSQISNLAKTAVINYFNTQLQQFEKPFYFSQLIENLNNIEPSILSALIGIKIQKRIIPVLNVSNAYIDEYSLKFNNKLHPNGLESTKFFIVRNGVTYTVILKDKPDLSPPDYNGTGTIIMYNVEDNTELGTIGTIDYATGEVTITNIVPVGYPQGQFEIAITCEAQEESYNILTGRNQIIVLDDYTESAVSNKLPGLTINVTAV